MTSHLNIFQYYMYYLFSIIFQYIMSPDIHFGKDIVTFKNLLP